jgi:cystathionine beta-synthase
MDWEHIDDVVRVNDKECFQMTRRVVREEGIFCGGSGGAAVSAALKWVRGHDRAGMNVLVLLPDSGSRYLTKIFDDNWMRENGFMEPSTGLGLVSDLQKRRGVTRDLVSAGPDARVSEVVGLMKLHGVSQVPVLENGAVLGILTETHLLERALKGGGRDASVRELAQANYTTVGLDTDVSVLVELFKKAKVALVVDGQEVLDIITRIDLIDYISSVTVTGGPA